MLADDIALTMQPEVGARTAIHLIECFGSAEAVFRASAAELVDVARLRRAVAEALVQCRYHAQAEQELAFCAQHHIRVLASDDPAYPALLRECPDYPHVLYVMGGIDLNHPRMLSVVGTRDATAYGLKMCDSLIGELGALFPDLVVVSGLAYGIDVAAHRAALQCGLPTVGVVAHPLNRIYPPRHTDVAREMARRGGAVVSEFHTGCRPDRSGFVQRNRIIAGLSMGTLVVESAARGGSLITAEMAGGYHREVMAVPGRVGDRCSEGANGLIRSNAAAMVCSGADIAAVLGWKAVPAEGAATQPTLFDVRTEGERRVLDALDADRPMLPEEVAERSGIALNELPELLLTLEFAGLVRALPGRLYRKY